MSEIKSSDDIAGIYNNHKFISKLKQFANKLWLPADKSILIEDVDKIIDKWYSERLTTPDDIIVNVEEVEELKQKLKEKCPECKGSGTIYVPMGRDFKGACLTCRSTGQAIIEIEKEMIPYKYQPELVRVKKYKVGDEIEVLGNGE